MMKKIRTLLLGLGILIGICGLSVFVLWISQYLKIRPIKSDIELERFPISENYASITVDLLSSIEEAYLLNESLSEDPILAIAQRLNGNILTINSEGWLTEWRWGEGKGWQVCRELDLKYARLGWVNFSADGSFVILPKGYDGEEVSGYAIWDTMEYQIVDESPDYEGYTTTGSYLSPRGDISVDYAEGTKFHVSHWKNRIAYPSNLFAFVREVYPVIGQVVIDTDQTFLAIAFETGQVSIGDIEEGDYFSTRQYHLLEEGETTEIRDLEFNSTRTRLAWLSGERLVVIRLQNLIFRIGIDIPVNDGRFLVFDRTGRILVVATQESLVFFDVIRNKQITVYPVNQEITSLFFTQDNRFLVWGDAEGNVHLLGVPVDK